MDKNVVRAAYTDTTVRVTLTISNTPISHASWRLLKAEVGIRQIFLGWGHAVLARQARGRTRQRLPSDGCIESELPRSRLTGTIVPFASDTVLTLCRHNRQGVSSAPSGLSY